MFKASRLLAAPIACVLLAACGGSTSGHAPARHAVAPQTRIFCSGLTDKCVPVGTVVPANPLQAAECKIPDVSNWQRHVNWAQAKPHVCGGIFKGGEGTTPDAYAADNNSQLTALHMWHAMYWYIRNVGCTTEANAIVAEAHRLHVQIVLNDLESPSDDAGYGACLPPLEKKAGLIVGDYTSPGTWSSSYGGFGAVPLWQAEYGPTLHPLWHPVVAWQCTDGHFGCVTNIPGIGLDDVSVDLGITKLGAAPVPMSPRCYHHGWSQPRTPANQALCNRVRKHDAYLGVVVKHESGYLAVSDGNRARLLAELKTVNGRIGVEQHNRAVAASALAADLRKFHF